MIIQKIRPVSTFILLLTLCYISTFDSLRAQDSLTVADYERAEQMLSWNLSDKIFNNSVSPNWIDDHQFWYRVQTRQGYEYQLVNASDLTKEHACV